MIKRKRHNKNWGRPLTPKHRKKLSEANKGKHPNLGKIGRHIKPGEHFSPATEFKKGQTAGSKNHRWNGGKTYDGYGYEKILKPNHPMADSKGYAYTHRYLMSKKLNRIIKKNEIVHHINGDKLDNKIENLELLTRKQHKSIHMKEVWAGFKKFRQSQSP